METLESKKEIVNFFIDKGFLISNEFILDLENEQKNKEDFFNKEIKQITKNSLIVLSNDFLETSKKVESFSISEFNRLKSFSQKSKNKDLLNEFIKSLTEFKEEDKPKEQEDVKIIFSYQEKSKKRTYGDFVSYFKSRYNQIKEFLINRQELSNTLSINKVLSKKEKESVSIIAMVSEKRTTKNGNIILTVEDQTGSIKVLINKNKSELHKEANDICLDEVLAIQGVNGGNIIFVNKILWPDIPLSKELRKSSDEAYAVFISDTEFGSKFFLKEPFNNFIKWLNSELGNKEQIRISSLVKYLFIIGDLVDGVGIYPGQEEDLIIPDIYEQYKVFADYLKRIPKHIKIIICPGNHDAMRIAEPQPPLYEDFAKPIYELPNTIIVSNPAYINFNSTDNFSGFDVLMYHGYSLIYYSENVNSIRTLGGQERVDLTMKYLLKRRHLAPTHQSTLSLPTAEKDHLIISKIPDFFVTGHIHRTTVSNYKNITLINASSWTGMTPNQEKRGLKPQPARAIITNLQTRQVKIMNFEILKSLKDPKQNQKLEVLNK